MRRRVKITTGIEPLFGTLDENLKLFESVHRVTTHLGDQEIEIEGETKAVERAQHFLTDYMQLVREGHELGNGEVQALLKFFAQDPNARVFWMLEALSAGATIIIDRDGREVYRDIGATAYDILNSAIEKAL